MTDTGTVKGLNSGYTPRDSMKPIETPVTDGGFLGEKRREHPAFAMIGACRWTGGGNVMFGSPIRHNSGVSIKIVEAYEQGDEYTWRQFGHNIVCEVNLSEAQWASFVTAMNVGNGVPCTLSYRQTGDLECVATIEDDHPLEKRAAMIRQKAEKDMALLREFVAKFDELLESGKITKGALKELRSKYLLHAVDHAPGNYEFAANMVSEHMEKAVTAARAEVESYVLQTAMRFPLLAQAAPEMPKLEPPKEST